MKYSDITIEKYLRIKEILKDSIENNDDDLYVQSRIISVLFDLELDDVLKLKVSDYENYSSQLTFLNEPIQPKADCPKSITINNKKYNIDRKVEHLSAGQYIDYQSFLKLNDESYINYILAIFLIPENKEYNIGYNIDDVAEDINKYMNIQTALNIFGFFQKTSLNSIKSTLNSLEIKLKIMKMFMRKKNPERELISQLIEKLKFLKNGVGLSILR